MSFFLQGVCQREHSSRSAGISNTGSHAAKKPKPVLEPLKPPSATLFSEHEQVAQYSPTLIAAGPHISAWLRLTKELCAPTGWYARFVQNTAYLHTVKNKNRFSSSDGFPLPFFKLMQLLIFNHHCCYCSICILPVHTVLLPQIEVVFVVKTVAPQFSPLDIATPESNKGCLYRKNIF